MTVTRGRVERAAHTGARWTVNVFTVLFVGSLVLATLWIVVAVGWMLVAMALD